MYIFPLTRSATWFVDESPATHVVSFLQLFVFRERTGSEGGSSTSEKMTLVMVLLQLHWKRSFYFVSKAARTKLSFSVIRPVAPAFLCTSSQKVRQDNAVVTSLGL